MGYFSQRKRREREKIFLKVMTSLIGIYTFLLFFHSLDNGFIVGVKNYLFQAYLLTLCILFMALYLERWLSGLFLLAFLLVQYTNLSSTANLFFNREVSDKHHINLTYQKGEPLLVEAKGHILLRSGHLNLSENLQAGFITFEKNQNVFTVIDVDFSKVSAQSRKTAYEQLRKFIVMQDDPVIVIGDFAETPWAKMFKKFLLDTELEVKNKVLLFDNNRRFNPFVVPTFYVLAFNNVGVNDIEFQAVDNEPLKVRTFLGFY